MKIYLRRVHLPPHENRRDTVNSILHQDLEVRIYRRPNALRPAQDAMEILRTISKSCPCANRLDRSEDLA